MGTNRDADAHTLLCTLVSGPVIGDPHAPKALLVRGDSIKRPQTTHHVAPAAQQQDVTRAVQLAAVTARNVPQLSTLSSQAKAHAHASAALGVLPPNVGAPGSQTVAQPVPDVVMPDA